MINFIKRFYEKLKLEKIAIVAVLITQSLKRFVQSEFGLLIFELAPLPWANLLGKVLGYLTKAHQIAPKILQAIIISKGVVSEGTDERVAMQVFADHLKYFSDVERAEFWRDYALALMNALYGDGVISDEERKQINDEAYQRLLKK